MWVTKDTAQNVADYRTNRPKCGTAHRQPIMHRSNVVNERHRPKCGCLQNAPTSSIWTASLPTCSVFWTAAFCAACGLDISRSKTKSMQCSPPRQCSQPRHTFNIGVHTLEVVYSYKYLGVHFHSSGKPAAYMTVALRSPDCSYACMRRQYCGMACSSNLQLQLRFFDALVTSSGLLGAELWGVHSSTGRQRKPHGYIASYLLQSG